MAMSTFVRASTGVLTAAAIWFGGAGPGGAMTLTLTNPSTQSDTPMTVVFTATSTESTVIDQGYQVNDIEKLTNNVVTLSGGGPNLLASSWRYAFAAVGSNAYRFNDGSSVPALGFAAQIRDISTRFTRRSRQCQAIPTPTASITGTTRLALALRLQSSS